MRWIYRGNFGVDFSTESHIAGSIEDLGYEVIRHQENEVSWKEELEASITADVFLWTSTFGYAQEWEPDEAAWTVKTLNEIIPTVGVHLDKWVGLNREDQLDTNPFFRVSDLFTADGDAQERFESHGINHHWLPPAVFGQECYIGNRNPSLASDIIFVGSWRQYGHTEHWPDRKAMLDYVLRRYRSRASFWPKGQAVRGRKLNDLFASSKIVLGDSCLAKSSNKYFSDRAFETVGRGGFLIMPYIEGLANILIPDQHCVYYQPGDFAQLGELIDYYLANEEEREHIRMAGHEFVRDHHTYKNRVNTILETISE